MDPFYRQDIFFLVTTVAVVILTLIIAVAAMFVILILKDVKYIAKKAKHESDLIAEDLNELRHNVKEQGFKAKYALSFFNNIFKRHGKK